jgi:hypothetical protein
MSNCVVGSGGFRLPGSIVAQHSVECCDHLSHHGDDDNLGLLLARVRRLWKALSAGSCPGNCPGMEETTGAPSSFTGYEPRRPRASSRDGGGVVNRPPSTLTMLLSRHTRRRGDRVMALFIAAQNHANGTKRTSRDVRVESAMRLPAQPVDATLYPGWKDGVYSVISEESRSSVSSQAHLNKVVRRLNERPRKALGIETPAERFNASVASTS